MHLELYTDIHGINLNEKERSFIAWTKDSDSYERYGGEFKLEVFIDNASYIGDNEYRVMVDGFKIIK